MSEASTNGGPRGSRTERVRPPLEAGPAGERQYDLTLLARLLPWARPHAALFLVTFLLIPVSALAGLVQPLLKRNAINAAIVDHSADALARVTLFFAVAVFVDFLAKRL